MKTALVALDSAKADKFALDYAANGNATRAYREAFDCSSMQRNVVNQRAWELVHTPSVKARIRELQAAAAERTIISVQARMEWLRDIVDADPSELVQHVRVNCRHCNGRDSKFQWRDAGELARALDAYRAALAAFEAHAGEPKGPRRPKPPADASGGFGFRPDGEHNADCPACDGEGIGRVIVADMTKLSGPARRLLKGVKQKADGSIEVLMHDQLAAADQLNKLQAAYTSVSVSASVSANAATLTPRQAAQLSPERLIDLLWKPKAEDALPAPVSVVSKDGTP